MANVQGNIDALEAVLGRIFALQPKNKVQEKLGVGAGPFTTVTWENNDAPITWTLIDVEGYAVLFLPTDITSFRRAPTLYASVMFGQIQNPDSSTFPPGALRVSPGQLVTMPQGFQRFYFRANAVGDCWTIVVIKQPNAGVSIPPIQDARAGVETNALAYISGVPAVLADGLDIDYSYDTVLVQLVTTGVPNTRLAQTVTAEIWWFFAGTRLWAHNPADDFDSTGLGDADATHDCELFEVPPGATGIAVRATNGATGWQAMVTGGVL